MTAANMGSSEEDYDESGKEGLSEEPSQPSQTLPGYTNFSRPSKRRKTCDSDNDSIEDFVVYENTSRSRESRRADIEENSPDEFERQAAQRRKSKYKIHIPRDSVAPPVTVQYGTQQQDDVDSSPYRIRGAKWKLPKVATKKSPPVYAQSSRQDKAGALLEKDSVFEPPPPLDPSLAKRGQSKEATSSLPPVEENVCNLWAPSLETPAAPSAEDIARELEDLPSDAFLSSPDVSPSLYPANPQAQSQQRLAGPRTGLRQTTLFGGQAVEDDHRSSQVNKAYNYRVDMAPEAPTHHQLDHEALKTWVYPTNLGPTRDYQFNIVRQGLFNNMLVALPTGLGKTFIAATIMLNYFRWTRNSQIVFMAPTKPLVSQQVEACFNIAGIPRSTTTMLTGEISPALRQQEWEDKRVFFMTPQTLENDLRTGIADPKKIVLLVVDEAHRATGNYSYVKAVSHMRRFSKSFRILALTATPGASVEAVQEVIDGLEISKVEIRTEESMDIQPFTHRRKIEQVLLDPSDEIIMTKDLLSKALKPLVDKLCAQNAYWNKDPMSLTPYGLLQAQKSWSMSDAGRRASFGLKGMISNLVAILSSIAHGIKLLNFHGIGPFYGTMKDFRAGVESQGSKGGKYRKMINDSADFKMLMNRIETWINKDDFIGHPKLTYLCDTILNHFLDAGEGRLPTGAPHSSTRVIVFAEYRDSAEEICRVLNRHKPMIRASVFVGQADSKRSEGMNQLKQIDTIDKFKTGVFNVLVATSIGEEGLDIGQVDLIVCYDASGSPIRMLQRMGRTGRKRAGNIVLLLMRGKEEESFMKSKDNYEQMQKMISSGSRFNFRHDLATRIVPKDISPIVDKRHVEIPLENTQDHSLPVPKRRATKPKKKSAKKFHMPDGVETGFRKASVLTKIGRGSQDSDNETSEDQLMPIPKIDSVLLSVSELKDLERSYQNIHGDEIQEVSMPEMTSRPEFQRILGPSHFVRHGKITESFVSMINTMRNMCDTTIERWQQIFEDEGPIREQLSLASQSPAPSLVSSVSSSFTSSAMQPGPVNGRAQKRRAMADKTSIRRPVSSLLADLSDNGESSDDQEEDEDDDLDGFIVADKEPPHRRHTASTLSSSPPPEFPPPKMKPFFEPTTFTPTQDTIDDDDAMPDLADLIGGRNAPPAPKPPVPSHVNVAAGPERGRNGRHRRILEEEDSDE